MSTTVLAHVSFIVLLASTTSTRGSVCFPQSAPHSGTAAKKLYEYGDLTTDDEAAHLDLFAAALFEQPGLEGYIIAYADRAMSRGSYLRRIHGVADYLSNSRGIDPDRVVVVDGGYAERFTTQLWIVPKGAAPPTPAPSVAQPQVNPSAPYEFDSECLECSPAVSIYLYGLGEGLRFYAQELRKNPQSKGLIVVRAGKHTSTREAVGQAKEAKKLLVKKYGVEADRIIVRTGRRRDDDIAVADMLIVPGR